MNPVPDSPVQYIKGVGPSRSRLLARLGVHTVEDLLFLLPRRYEDYSATKRISDLIDGERATVVATVVSTQVVHSRRNRRLSLVVVKASDLSGILEAKWFYMSGDKQWIERKASEFIEGCSYLFSGTVKREGQSVSMLRPTCERAEGAGDSAGKIVPIYPLTEGLSQSQLRRLIENAFSLGYADALVDPVKPELLVKYGLPRKAEALSEIHFPTDVQKIKRAFRRIAFEEFLLLQVGLALKRHARQTSKGIAHSRDGDLVRGFLSLLPFKLTSAQSRVIDEIRADMESEMPMNRLVQGDVGSGKTVVAAYALVKAVESGYQGALMAPTEVLANQHFSTLVSLFSPLGISVRELRGGTAKAEREAIYRGLQDGSISVVVGTHALIQERVEFARLGLVITDEQHRFGVGQRAFLQKKGERPDVLVMTATPIPRTLAMTLYGDLEVSVIDELPPGRKPVVTRWVRASSRHRAYQFLRKEIGRGGQAYVICPLVEESEVMDLKSVAVEAEELERTFLSGLRIGSLHGRMTSGQKERVIREFAEGRLDVLVSTTVVEVGVDVPNASVIVIENAERFGLSQLHQLRGRVGRSTRQSYCILVSNASSTETVARLNAMTRTNDGFEIAEEDLRLRGPGEIFGTRQHGLPDTRVANILRYMGVMKTARDVASNICLEDPMLKQDENKPLRIELNRRFGDWLDLSAIG
jgi:ATP-dependent DNA helicase RecG